MQFSELMRDVYHLALSRSNVENSEFVNGAQNSKNCYLCFSLLESSDCLYCLSQYYGNDNIDCAGTLKCQLCYSCRDIDNCYECQHCADCWSCHSCFGCAGCRSCSDCFGCYGLEHAKYCFFNEQLSKERYEQEIQKLRLGSFSGRSSAVAKCADFIAQSGFSPKRIINAEGCTGSYIFRSSNISSSYHTIETQDCGHMLLSIYSRDCWKGWASKGELCYSSGVIESTNVGYSYSVWGGEELWYSYFLYGASHCFGSAMLKNNRYCILNKQYSKSEYLELLPRIVSHMKSTGEWGRVVPASFSPHPYSESFAKLYLEDLPSETLRRRGYRLEEAEEPVVEAAAIDSSSLPDDIAEVEATKLAGAVVRCAETGKNFNLQRAELEFYKKLSIPLPRRHWRVRLNELILARELMPEVLDLS